MICDGMEWNRSHPIPSHIIVPFFYMGRNTMFHGQGMEQDGTAYEMRYTGIDTKWDGTHHSPLDGTQDGTRLLQEKNEVVYI